MLFRFATIAALLTANVALHAANIFSVTGASLFGLESPPQALGWNQTATYTNVSITMPLRDSTAGGPIATLEGTVYLMRQVGPGTTAANEVVAPVQVFGLTASFAPRTLFSGLTLAPGNYYLVFVPTTATPPSMTPAGTGSPTVTPGSGVTDLGSGGSGSSAVFPPATDLNPDIMTPENFLVTVTGDLTAPSAKPAPSSLILLLTGLAGVGLFAAKRKFARVG
jgi:hypothetical protein